MYIESIHIEHFGKLHDFDLAFDSRLNIIEGANESGKSTVAAFLRFMLYGFSTADKAELSDRKKYLSWQTGSAEGSMRFSAGGKHYETRRAVTVDKDGRYTETNLTVDCETGLPAFPRTSVGDALLGVPDSVFTDTVFVGQIGNVKVGGRSVSEAIENLIFSGDEKVNTERAKSELDEAKNSLLHPGGKGGVLYKLHQKQDDYARRLAIAQKEQYKIAEKEAALAQAREKKRDSEKQESSFRAIENDYKNAMLIKTYDYLHELEENAEAVDREIAVLEKENTVDGFTPTRETLDSLIRYAAEESAKREERDEAFSRAEEAEKKVCYSDEEAALMQATEAHGGEEEVRAAAKKHTRAGMRNILFASLCLLLFAASFLADFLLFRLSYFPLNPKAIVALIFKEMTIGGAVAFFLLALRAGKRFRALAAAYHEKTYAGLCRKLDELHAVNDRMTALRAEANAERKNMLSRRDAYLDCLEEISRFLMNGGETLPKDDPAGFISGYTEKIRAYLQKRDDLEKKKSGVTNVMRELRVQLEGKNEVQVRATVSPKDRDKLASMNHRELVDGIEHYRRLSRFYDDRVRELERQLLTARSQAEDPLLLSAEIGLLQEKTDAFLARHSAYTLAEDALSSAGERLRTEITPRLAEDAGRFMYIATDGKYGKPHVSSDIEIGFTDGGSTRAADFFSAGTQDLAYLALRMALIDILYDETPPVFFDESFVHQDDERARGLMRAVQSLSDEGKQFFLFTCHNREAVMAKDVFREFSHILVS